ncbi:MAG: hypothetical protein SO170_06040 [Butyribacter sp.]|nr:hypothetical protein [bacterium]MDY3854499.1 hypothetical protein [Butyribacter sp.]
MVNRVLEKPISFRLSGSEKEKQAVSSYIELGAHEFGSKSKYIIEAIKSFESHRERSEGDVISLDEIKKVVHEESLNFQRWMQTEFSTCIQAEKDPCLEGEDSQMAKNMESFMFGE